MTIIQTAYETLTEKARNMTSVREAVQFAIAAGNLDTKDMNHRIVYINQRNTVSDNIPPFLHPLQVNPKDPDLLAVDMRPYVTTKDGNIVIRRPDGYQLQMARALFNLRWLSNSDKQSLLAVSSIPMAAYSEWVAGSIGGKLTFNEVVQLKVLAAFFYYCQFFDNDEFLQPEVAQITQLISRATRLTLGEVSGVMSQLENENNAVKSIPDIVKFCSTFVEIADTSRARSLTAGVLVPALANTWDGNESKALLATAIEFPPCWMAFVLMSCISRQHMRSRLSMAVQRTMRKEDLSFVAKALMASINFEANVDSGIGK